MNEDKRQLHLARFPIRWGDMDAMGHVNNIIYFQYMEQARVEWMALSGFAASSQATKEGPVIAKTSCVFKQPLVFPGMIEVRMMAGAPGRTSLMTYYEIRREGDTNLAAEGEALLVWISTETGRPMPLPSALAA